MFEKLLAVLPYNPSLAHQMRFYARRMHEEAGIRRLGLIFMVLTFMVQFFAVLSPPKTSLAASCSDNDIIKCGVDNAADARKKCVDDVQGFQRLLHHYGISCKAFDNAFQAGADNSGITATTNNKYFSVGRQKSVAEDAPRNVDGTTYYWRPLATFGEGKKWPAIGIKDYQGNTFYVLYDCGNLVWKGGVPAGNQLPPTQEDEGGIIINPNPVTPPVAPPPVAPPPVAPPPVAPPPPPPVTPCPYNNAIPATDAACVPPCQYNPTIPASSAACVPPCKYNPSLPAGDAKCFPPCEYNSAISAEDDKACKPCEKSTGGSDSLSCVAIHKAAANVTTGQSDANGTTVKASDVITYTLFAENQGKAQIKGYTFQENLSDVLDYADVTDLHGGTMGPDKVISWPSQVLDAGKTISVQVTVKVKDPIPSDQVSPGNPFHFDLTMTNVYGNTVNIKLPAPPAKAIQTAAATLPNTGPGTSLFIGAVVVIMASYFYSRSRLLARESELAIQETVSA